MKAAIFYGPNQPLKIEEVQVPKLGLGEILVKVAACGVCHTDLHYIDHGVPTFKKPPMILGHEASGTVAQLGEEVTNVKIGDRILLPSVLSCGKCEYCETGRGNICLNMAMLGNHVDGAYAEFIKIPAIDAIHLPEEIPLVEGSIIADAVSTPFHAIIDRAKVQPGEKVVVFGCGGLGINCVQIASSIGATVIAVDIVDKKLEWAKKLGAVEVINPTQEDVKKKVRKLTKVGADVAIEAVGRPETIELAFDCIRSGGRLCQVGYTDKKVSFSAARIMFREMQIVGVLGCPAAQYLRLVEMIRVGKLQIKPLVTHRFKLDQINDAFDTLRKGELLRAVIVMD